MIPANIKVICISVDIVAVFICLLLKYDFGADMTETHEYDKKIFNWLLISTMAILVLDMSIWAILNIKEYYFINFIFTAMYYSLHLVIATLWIMYCDYKIYENEKRVKRIKNIFSIPAIIAIIASIASYKYPILFTITKDNVYYRGRYYNIFILAGALYILYSIYIVLNRMNQNRKNDVLDSKLSVLIVYPSIPIVGILAQTMYYGVNIVWMLTTISLLTIYFNFQNSLLIIDPITKINNRYKFDLCLDKHFDEPFENEQKFLIIADINKFKDINDKFGHLEGDNALRIIAKILASNAGSEDLVARLGGDEFAIFGKRHYVSEIEDLVQQIHEAIIQYNNSKEVNYAISLSLGYSIQDEYNSKTRDQMITEADTNMYKQKEYYIC